MAVNYHIPERLPHGLLTQTHKAYMYFYTQDFLRMSFFRQAFSSILLMSAGFLNKHALRKNTSHNLVIAWFGHRERGITGVFLLPIFPRRGPRRLAKQPNKKHVASPTASEHKHSTLLGSKRCAAAPGNSGLDDVKVLPELDFYGMTFAARLSMMHLCYREASCLQGFQFCMWRA